MSLCINWLDCCAITGYKECFGITAECITTFDAKEAYEKMEGMYEEVAGGK